jgi:hypothetical protein
VRWAKKRGKAWLRSMAASVHAPVSAIVRRYKRCKAKCTKELVRGVARCTVLKCRRQSAKKNLKVTPELVRACAQDCMMGLHRDIGSLLP